MMIRRTALAVLAAALALLATPALASAASQPFMGEQVELGSAKAPITVIEYASASCPHCARFNNNVFPEFKAKYIDTGKIHYVFHEMLVGEGPELSVAAAGFLLARCAGKDKYFPVVDQIFHEQAAMFQSGDIRTPLLRIAQSAGMSEDQFKTCVGDQAALKALNDRVVRASKDGVNETPTFIINGNKITGEQTLAQLDKAIADAEKN